MTITLGLTGGVASGKSTVSGMFASLGAAIIDADVGAREVVATGTEGLAEVVRHFGSAVLHGDGTLNRQRLGEIVFKNPAERRVLESIIHPRVAAWMSSCLVAYRASGKELVVLDIPLLFESGKGIDLCNFTAVVWVPQEIQLQRLMARNSFSREEALLRIGSQLPLDLKRDRANFCIDNSGTRIKTEAQVMQLWAELTGKQK